MISGITVPANNRLQRTVMDKVPRHLRPARRGLTGTDPVSLAGLHRWRCRANVRFRSAGSGFS